LQDVAYPLETTDQPVIVIGRKGKGQFVYVVKPDKGVDIRMVTLGPTRDRKVVIEKGVAGGETVVTDGQLMLYPGAHVMPVSADKVPTGAGSP
jgi:multidrug efflux system membrane fusion protein